MFDNKGRFIIQDYSVKSTFANFLPGISGKFGIPIWCFYVNRGQGVTSFGVEDKEHSIMEFYPAHQSYQLTKQLGFRTFLKLNGSYYEPFNDDLTPKKMYIGMNEFEVEETNIEKKIKTNIIYFTLPGENLGGLVRKVTIKNLDAKEISLEMLDGMPAILPYGVSIGAMKEMGQTTKAWMQVEDVEESLPYFRVRVSMDDSSEVHKIEEGHFHIAIGKDGENLHAIVDPNLVFEYDTAMIKAVGFEKQDIDDLLIKKQITQNNLPCSFFGGKFIIKAEQEITIYEVIGQVAKKELLKEFAIKCIDKNYFDEKYKETTALTDDLSKAIYTKTALPVFDAYCNQTYLDNILRGGYPIILGTNKIFHLYSRKHGDIERDYNFFSMLPEYYSQGNANFRDVNQNRRCDVLFAPYVKEKNIKTFYNLIQTDGYNPLLVQKTTYFIDKNKLDSLIGLVNESDWDSLKCFLKQTFTPGGLLSFVTNNSIVLTVSLQEFLDTAIEISEETANADFGEGYWSDHWTYNLDLIETYLAVYPDDEKHLLFEDCTYTYFESIAIVKPRKERYVLTENGVRQYNALDRVTKKEVTHKFVKTQYGEGKIFTTNLMVKIILLDVIKFATLDPYGMGIEMEGGKPGWYDALNGLPGIFGSSMCETYELHRMIEFTIEKLGKYNKALDIPKELFYFMIQVNDAVINSINSKEKAEAEFICWCAVNDAKEQYRKITIFGVDGGTVSVMAKELIDILNNLLTYIKKGIKKAIAFSGGISPTYFAYRLVDYIQEYDGIKAKKFEVILMPDFLEGPVRFLKLSHSMDVKKEAYINVKNSTLYDKKLNMYKVNESLEKASFEIGRTKAFTPGWLENESIWLHMEYKYLLEMLKSGLYQEFFTDFANQCIPFLDANVYGRSLLENSSFIASSANPNESIHGKGFVARLSGSTAEFIHIWQLMMFGKQPFNQTNEGLQLSFTPTIPKYLINEKKQIVCTFLGTICVKYLIDKEIDIIPGQYRITRMEVTYADNKRKVVIGDKLLDEDAKNVREGKATSIEVSIEF